MARPREFDEEEVLDATIECFWRRGLEATSVRDLAEATGVNQPSLYNAFGDKRELFARALERYATLRMRERIKRLEQKHLPREAIHAFFRELVSHTLSDPDHRGCLIVNSALEVAPHDAELRTVIASYLGEIEAFFARCLEQLKRGGDLSPNVDPQDTARLFVGVLLGVRVAARAKPERALLEGMVRPALALLEHRRQPSRSGQGTQV